MSHSSGCGIGDGERCISVQCKRPILTSLTVKFDSALIGKSFAAVKSKQLTKCTRKFSISRNDESLLSDQQSHISCKKEKILIIFA